MSETPRPISLLFDAIAQYCTHQGWVPVGWREFTVDRWRFQMNGTKEERESVPPYHCAITDHDLSVFILVHPFGGGITGGTRPLRAVEADVTATLLVAAQKSLEGRDG